MNTQENIEKLIKNAVIHSNPNVNKAVLKEFLQQFDNVETQKPAVTQPKIRRTIMKSPITKLAAAAVIIALVVLGLFEFIGTESTSGVVWAEVARKVEASRGLIVRRKESIPPSEDDYSIIYNSPRHCRTDFYKDGQITRTCYKDFTGSDTDALIDVFHLRKHYLVTKYKKAGLNGVFPEQHEGAMNPELLVQTILSGKHRKLAQKTIEGVLCEGIETTDPACMSPIPEYCDRLDVLLRLWVSAETGYPVLFERKISVEYKGEVGESESVMDQFQWDVELDPSIFEPNIPTDYERVERPGVVGL